MLVYAQQNSGRSNEFVLIMCVCVLKLEMYLKHAIFFQAQIFKHGKREDCLPYGKINLEESVCPVSLCVHSQVCCSHV